MPSVAQRGLKANPNSVHCLQSLARLERKQGNVELSRALLKRALKLDPDNAPALQVSRVSAAAPLFCCAI
jgi:cytochrome c-type biogenesis protein CcmH/NrfG